MWHKSGIMWIHVYICIYVYIFMHIYELYLCVCVCVCVCVYVWFVTANVMQAGIDTKEKVVQCQK